MHNLIYSHVSSTQFLLSIVLRFHNCFTQFHNCSQFTQIMFYAFIMCHIHNLCEEESKIFSIAFFMTRSWSVIIRFGLCCPMASKKFGEEKLSATNEWIE